MVRIPQRGDTAKPITNDDDETHHPDNMTVPETVYSDEARHSISTISGHKRPHPDVSGDEERSIMSPSPPQPLRKRQKREHPQDHSQNQHREPPQNQSSSSVLSNSSMNSDGTQSANPSNLSTLPSLPSTKRMRRLSQSQLNNDMIAMSRGRDSESFQSHRNAQQSAERMESKVIMVDLSLEEPQKDILELLSHLSDAVFLELRNKRISGFNVEFNFITLGEREIQKLLDDQIRECRQVHLYQSNELRADANSKLQLLFTLYVLVHLRTVVVDSSITLALVYFKHIYADSVYKSLLDRNWISRTCIAPHIEHSLKQSMMAVIERKIVDHPKMARVAEIATLIRSEWKEQRRNLRPKRNGMRIGKWNENGIGNGIGNVDGTEALKQKNGKLEADDVTDGDSGGDAPTSGSKTAEIDDKENCNVKQVEAVEHGNDKKPPTLLVVVEHFTLLKIMEKYMSLHGLEKTLSVLEQSQNADAILDVMMLNNSWFIATTVSILTAILKTSPRSTITETFCASISRMIIFSERIQTQIGRHYDCFDDEMEVMVLRCRIPRKFAYHLLSQQICESVPSMHSVSSYHRDLYEIPEHRLGIKTKIICAEKWTVNNDSFRRQLAQYNIWAIPRSMETLDFIITSVTAVAVFEVKPLPKYDEELRGWIQSAMEFTKYLTRTFPKYKTLYLIIAYPVHQGHRANVSTIRLAAIRRMQQTVIWYLLKVKYGAQHEQIPVIRTVTTFDLKSTLIPSLLEIIKKEYVHIELEPIDDGVLGAGGVVQDDEAQTQWNSNEVGSEEDDGLFVINSYLDGHQYLLEQILCAFPSLNPFSAQRMLQSQLTLKV